MSLGRVVDKTGLQGRYDFRLEYAGTHSAGGAIARSAADGQPSGIPDLFDAVQRQLGLKIDATKAPTDILVVDHVERMPTKN